MAFSALLGSFGCHRADADERAASAGPPTALASAALTDQDGRPRSFADFRDKTVVFNLFFSSCPTVCPRATQALSEVQRGLSPALKERVQFVSLSVDPENDSPEVMRKFALASGVQSSGWSFVRTSAPATRALTQQLEAFQDPAKAQAEPSGHTTAVYLFDGAGRLMQRYAGSPLDVARLGREIEQLDAWFREKKET